MGSLVTRQIGALFNGVSQQPATLRLPSQCEEQVNVYSSIVDGVRKRPPFEHVARLSTGSLESAFMHTINRDTLERYIVVITDGDLKVFDTFDGTERPVNFPVGKEYLEIPEGMDAADCFAVVTVADYSFIVNRTQLVETKPAPVAPPTHFEHWYYPANWAYAHGGGHIYYNPNTPTWRGTKQTFQDLPAPEDDNPPQNNDLWRIAGHDLNGFGAYHVIRRGGVWEETTSLNGGIGLDEETMPHALVSNADGSFEFTVFPWKVRKVGDNDTNPPPTFVGRPIKDVFFYRNRLGFISDENIILSCAGDYGNFWRTTVTDLLDSDVVDAAVSSTKVSLLQYAVPFNAGLMLFADQSQFQLNAEGALTPSTVSIDTVTEFEMSTRVRPVGIGTDVYFITQSGQYSRVREYFVQPDSSANDANDITQHVPRYLPRDITTLAGNDNEEVLFAVSPQTPKSIWAYKFVWMDATDKAQAAWGEWQIAGEGKVLTVATLENQLYAVIQRADGAYLERCDIQSGAETGDMGRQILLDRLMPTEGVYNGAAENTEFLLPFRVAEEDWPLLRLVYGSGHSAAMGLVDPSQYDIAYQGNETRITVPGDHSGWQWAGLKYEKRYRFSEQFIESRNGAITTGRLMLRTFALYFTDTAYFKTEVAPYGIDPLVETVIPSQLSEFTGKTLGDSALVLNEPVYATGSYAFQVYGDSRVAKVTLVNDSHVQSVFQSAEWEALYHNRARPLG